MKKLNKSSDVKKYLKNGTLTEPFLETEYVHKVIAENIQKCKEQNINRTELKAIVSWVKNKLKSTYDVVFEKNNKFQRTAKEIWESGISTGCTDYCLVFATLARQMGYSTTILLTAAINFVIGSQTSNKNTEFNGHVFCECFENNKWVLIDPTFREKVEDYNTQKIELPYKVAAFTTFIPYKREIDMGGKYTVNDHNRGMWYAVKNIKI